MGFFSGVVMNRYRYHAAILLMSLVVLVGQTRASSAQTVPSGFVEEIVFDELTDPTVVQFASDGRVFVAEKSGLIKVFPSLTVLTPSIFADLRIKVHNYWDRGLLGMALHPNFPTTPYVYVLYTHNAVIGGTAPLWPTVDGISDGCPTPPGPTTDGCVVSGRLSRLTASGSVMTGTEVVLLEGWCQQFPSHSIGSLAFGSDGALYVSGGDGASFTFVDYGQTGSPQNPCGDPPSSTQTPPTAEGGSLRSQSLERPAGEPALLNGAILRVNPDTGAGLPDNPLAASLDPNDRRVIAYGLRNPFRFTPRPGTSEIWVGDVGWTNWEEINRIVAPTSEVPNFGWPCYEGDGRQGGYDAANLNICESLYSQSGAVTPPTFRYAHSDPIVPGENCGVGSSSISGLAFYNGGNYPTEYNGALFFSDYSRSCIWTMFNPAGQSNTQPTVLWQQTLVNGNAAGIPFDLTTAVLPGDSVDFGINRGPDASWGCDTTAFDPSIVFTPSAPPSAPTTYQASADFSSSQGLRNWYYLYGSGTPMTFDSAANWWRGNESYLLLWGNGGHPGNVGDAIRRWIAPQAGSIRITGNAADLDAACGAGAMVYIKKNPVGSSPTEVQTFAAPAAGPVYLTTGPNGDLFYVDFDGGTIRRIRYATNQAPTAVAQAAPVSGSAPLTVVFNGSASTDPDAGDTITYAWDLDADGQFDDSTAAQPSFTYTVNGTYQVGLRVTDNHGASSTASVTITVGTPNAPPAATIDSPTGALAWSVGSVIDFSGHAMDPEDGILPAAALSWRIILHHCPSNCHAHTVTDFVGVASGSFVAPDHDYPSHLEIQLTATDSKGLTNVKSVLINPQTVSLSFASVPSGLQLTVGSSNSVAPFSRTVIRNSQNSVSAVSPQSLNGSTYQFVSWSDGGAQSHIITASATATYTATYGLATSITYQASTDFSATQGVRNWYYLYGSGVQMTFDTAANRWRGNETYLLLWADGGHPGNVADAIRRWVAPQSGSIRITGSATDIAPACGAGAMVYIKKNAATLWQQTLNGNSAAFDLTTTVVPGDGINFGINRGPDNWGCDTTTFDPTIVLTPSGSPPPQPTVSIADATVTEGNAGSVNAVFTVSLSAASTQTVTVQYATANGTATAGSDYTPASGTVTFAPGELSKAVSVAVLGDTAVEPTETFVVNLSNATNATIGDGQGVGTITNDDTTGSTTYRAATDFSATQGSRNWYYLYGSGVQMTFDSAANRWRGNETYLLLWADGGHPGNAADAIRRWSAPQSGSIRITGNAVDIAAGCGAGAMVYIKKNAVVLWQQTLPNGASAAFDVTTTVLPGDGINFGINRGPDDWGCDTTTLDPTIVFTPS